VRDIGNSPAVSMSGCITRFSEREVAVLRHLLRTFLKMSKQFLIHSTENNLLLKYDNCQPFGTPDRLLTAIQKKPSKCGIVQEFY
jgi:hypothetical protein